MHLYVGANQLNDDTVGSPELGKECKLTYLGTVTKRIKFLFIVHIYSLSFGAHFNFRPQWELSNQSTPQTSLSLRKSFGT